MRIRRAFAALLAVVTLGAGTPIVLLLDVAPAGAAPTTTRASVASDGTEADFDSHDVSISADGRFVAFDSAADNLVPDDSGMWDVFVHDRQTGATEKVSVAADGGRADSSSFNSATSLSGDGRYVAFQSGASNLVTGDTNGSSDVFVRDRTSGVTERVSAASDGTQSNNWSGWPSISADGRYVAFESNATNLVFGDTNGKRDVFVHDRQTGVTSRVSVATDGTQAGDSSGFASLSGDGRYVAFQSDASNLVSGDSNATTDVFVHDMQAGTTTRVSVASDTTQGNNYSDYPNLSADGRYVAFESMASNLVADDTNGTRDVFVHDVQTGGTGRVSIGGDGAEGNDQTTGSPTISADGRYVAFGSAATNLVVGDTGRGWDVFVHDATTGGTNRVSIASGGTEANSDSYYPAISGDGRFVAFESDASNLVAGDTNASRDIFLHDQGVLWVTRPPAELYGHRLSGGYASDPVNTATGNFSQTDVDLAFPEGVFGLDWRRTYNSLDTTSGPFSAGWSSGFGARVAESPDGSVAFTDWDGRQVTFHPLAGGGWDHPEELLGDLHRDLDGTLSLSFFNGQSWDFDSQGRLAGESNWDGQTVSLAYDTSSRLSSATSSTGYSLTFAYDTSNRLTQVSTSDGRHVSYTYGTNGDLATMTDAAGGVTTYTTTATGQITAIADADNKPVLTNTYDSQDRVATQTTPSSATVTFGYDDDNGVTTVTHAGLGSVVSYAHDHHGRLTQVTDPYGAVLSKTYDATGNLTGITDRRGAGTTQTFDGHGNLQSRSSPGVVNESFTYDSADRLVSSTDGEGKTTSYGYTASCRVPSTITDPTGAVSTYTVGADGLVSAATDADGVTLAYGYDASRNLTSVTDAAGKTTVLTYEAAGNLSSRKTPLLHTTSFGWDADGRLLSTTDPTGAVSSQTWTPAGRLASQTDAANKTTTFAYDSAGRLASQTDPLANVTAYGYDVDGNLTSVTRPGGSVWHATYDKLGRRLSETDPTGVATTYGYDADGNVTATTDAAGKTTAATYDLRGRLTAQTDALNRTTSYAYDHDDRLVSTTDPAGAVTGRSYDPVGRLVETVDPLGKHRTRTYTPAGRPAGETDPNLHPTTHSYDTLGRLQSTTDALSGQTIYGYNADGLLTTVTSPAGLVTTYGYDAAGRRTTVAAPATGTTTTGYTARGEVATVTDATGGVGHYTYDPDGRLAAAVDADNHSTRYGYDARGNLTTRTDARGGVEQWTYDLADRVLTHADQLHRTTTLAYDPVGRLQSVTQPSTRQVTFAYDAAGQVTSRTFGDGSVVSYQYDPAGRRIHMTDPSGVTTYAYDAAGHLTSTTNPAGKTIAATYGPAGNRASLTYPNGAVADYGYDADGRLTSLANTTAGTTSYGYDADGRLTTEALPGGVSRAYSYTSGRLAGYSETRGATTRSTTLGYDPAGRIATDTTAGITTSYSYDPAGQLTSETSGGATTSYGYDRVGNRVLRQTATTNTAYAYDPAQELLTASDTPRLSSPTGTIPVVTSYTYDLDGRQRLQAGPTGTVATTYDAEGNLAQVANATVAGAALSTDSRTHNGDGQLTGATVTTPLATTTNQFTWDPTTTVPQVAAITTGGTDSDFLYGQGRAVALRAGVADVFSHDVHGSDLTTTDTADWVRAGGYDTFGNPTGLPDPTKDQQPRFGYRGELNLDGLIHLRARDYNPTVGRFTTTDPLPGRPGTPTVADPYPYAANDPLNQVDPLGLSPVKDGDLRSPGTVDPNVYLRSWQYGTQDALVRAILRTQASGHTAIVETINGYDDFGGITGISYLSGTDYIDRWNAMRLQDADVEGYIAGANGDLANRMFGSAGQKLLLAGGAAAGVGLGACALIPGCIEVAGTAALIEGARGGKDIQDFENYGSEFLNDAIRTTDQPFMAASETSSFVSGQTFETTVNSSAGNVGILAQVEINGSELVLQDVAIYGEEGDLVNQVGAREFLALRNEIARQAAAEGFDTLRIVGTRVLGSSSAVPGKTIDIVVDLARFR